MDIERIYIEGLRRKTPQQKLEMVGQLNRAVQQLALADIKRRYPDADDKELRLRLASRWIDPHVMLKAFGWDVEKQGY